jgi:hypothetical protein
MDCKLEGEIRKNLKCNASVFKIFVHVVVYINPTDILYMFKYEIFNCFIYAQNFIVKIFGPSKYSAIYVSIAEQKCLLRLHIKLPYFCSDFNRSWNVATNFIENLQCQI